MNEKVPAIVTYVLAALVGGYGAVVAVVGLPFAWTQGTADSATDTATTVSGTGWTGITPQALAFVLAAVLLVLGVVRRNWVLAWSGWALTAVSAVLSGFSIGLYVLPVVPVLLAALVALTIVQRRRDERIMGECPSQ